MQIIQSNCLEGFIFNVSKIQECTMISKQEHRIKEEENTAELQTKKKTFNTDQTISVDVTKVLFYFLLLLFLVCDISCVLDEYYKK